MPYVLFFSRFVTHVTILDAVGSFEGKKLLVFNVFTVYVIIFLSPLSYIALKINLGNTDFGKRTLT